MTRRSRRNRRKQDTGAALHAPMIAVLVLAAIVFISFLWLGGRCEDLGRRIKAAEKDYESLHRRVLTEDMKWTRMKSPGRVRVYLQKHNLQMDWPKESHIVRIPMTERRAFDPEGKAERVELARAFPGEARHD